MCEALDRMLSAVPNDIILISMTDSTRQRAMFTSISLVLAIYETKMSDGIFLKSFLTEVAWVLSFEHRLKLQVCLLLARCCQDSEYCGDIPNDWES